jgi:hypothetical protein
MDRQERGQARRVAAIKWSMKHKKQQKPIAPVEETNEGKVNKGDRLWLWIGEEIESKNLVAGHLYSSGYLRLHGFKLPKLKKKEKKKTWIIEPDSALGRNPAGYKPTKKS